MVAEAAAMNNDAMLGQVFQFLDRSRGILLVYHAVGKHLDDILTVMAIVVMEMGIHT